MSSTGISGGSPGKFLISCLLPYIVGSETPLPDTLE